MQVFSAFTVLYQQPGEPFPSDGGTQPVHNSDTLATTLVQYFGALMEVFAERDGMPHAITISGEAAKLLARELGEVPAFIFPADSGELYLVTPSISDVPGVYIAAMSPERATIGARFHLAEMRVN